MVIVDPYAGGWCRLLYRILLCNGYMPFRRTLRTRGLGRLEQLYKIPLQMVGLGQETH